MLPVECLMEAKKWFWSVAPPFNPTPANDTTTTTTAAAAIVFIDCINSPALHPAVWPLLLVPFGDLWLGHGQSHCLNSTPR